MTTPADDTELFAICQAHTVEDGASLGFVLLREDDAGQRSQWPIVILRRDGRFFGYVNRCPHRDVRLDADPDRFVTDDDGALLCGHHGARFDPATGHCESGPCRGEHLEAIDLVIDDGDVCIAGVRLVEEDGMHLRDPYEWPEVLILPD